MHVDQSDPLTQELTARGSSVAYLVKELADWSTEIREVIAA